MTLLRPFETILLRPPVPPPDAQLVAAFERDWSTHVSDEYTLFTYAVQRWRSIDVALKQLLQQAAYLVREVTAANTCVICRHADAKCCDKQEPSARMVALRLELFRAAMRRVLRSLTQPVAWKPHSPLLPA